jgi:GT2 family glycosyltransferase
VLESDYPNLEIIVVDNKSTDSSLTYLSSLDFSRVTIVRNSHNNYSLGLNLGLRVAEGKYVLYLNNDTVLQKDTISKLVKAMNEDSEIALAQGLLLSYFNPKMVDSKGETMDFYGNSITIGADQPYDEQDNQSFEILSASGSASIMRRDVVQTLRGFDDRYYMGYEDMDLGLRVRLAGYKVILIPDAIVYHRRGYTNLKKEVRLESKFHFNKNRIATLIKNYEMVNLLKAIPIVILNHVMAFVYEAIFEHDSRKALKRISALIWNLTNAKYLFRKRAIIQGQIRHVPDKKIFRLMSWGKFGKLLIHAAKVKRF